MSIGVIIFLVLIVVFVLNSVLASKASDIAEDKGYERRVWFNMCFWLGPLSYIIIAAMPDQLLRSKQDLTNELLREMIESYDASTKNQIHDHNDDISSYLPEL